MVETSRVAEFAGLIGRAASAHELRRVAESALAEGRRLVVGAVVADEQGRVYVQRRSPERELFPGCWDVVGGHAEPGEGVAAALAREVREETGWRLVRLEEVLEVADWSAGGEDKREIDLVVSVAGDLAAPLLEPGKHDLGRWLSADETAVLDEPIELSDGYVRGLVEAAFGAMAGRRR